MDKEETIRLLKSSCETCACYDRLPVMDEWSITGERIRGGYDYFCSNDYPIGGPCSHWIKDDRIKRW
jgi:hypothetical protein